MSEHTESHSGAGETQVARDALSALANDLPSIALLYTDEALLAHVDEALTTMSAPIVYRAPLAQADQAALMNARPAIALINLDDGGCDERLDAVTAWLDGAGVPIVFNDAEISRKLEGWARARWARHLAAKLRGSEDVYPARPASASQGSPASALHTPCPTSEEREEASQEIPVAARPLTPAEIQSLVADFPSDVTIAGEDTAALAAHVDALLANVTEEPAAHQPAPWEMIAPLEPVAEPVAAAATESAPVPAAAKTPSFSDWQLVDDVAPVVSAPREKPAEAAAALPFADFKFDLEPIEEVIPPAIVHERVSQELRLEEAVSKSARRKA